MLRGKSGVVHTFTRVLDESNVRKVVEEYSREIDEMDILKFHMKVVDVGPCSAVILAPSYTNECKVLALSRECLFQEDRSS